MIYLSLSVCVCRRDTFMSARRLFAQLSAVKISANITIACQYRTFSQDITPVFYNLNIKSLLTPTMTLTPVHKLSSTQLNFIMTYFQPGS